MSVITKQHKTFTTAAYIFDQKILFGGTGQREQGNWPQPS